MKHAPASLIALALALCLIATPACITNSDRENLALKRFSQVTPGIRSDLRREVLRTQANEFLIDTSAIIEVAADTIATQTDDRHARRNALLWKTSAIPAFRNACYRPGPLGALYDAWTLALQMKTLVTTGPAANAFGEHQQIAIDAADQILDDIQRIWTDITPDQQAFDRWEQDYIATFAEQNPITDLGFARTSPVAQFAHLTIAGGNAVDRIQSLEEQVDLLSNQTRNTLNNAHKQVRWETQLILDDLTRQMDLESLGQSTTQLIDSVAATMAIVEDAPELLAEQRALIFEAVGQERDIVLEALNTETSLILEHISRERDEVIVALALERQMILEDISRQRIDTLDRVEDYVQAERAFILEGVDRITETTVTRSAEIIREAIDALLLRMILLTIAILLLIPVVAHAYARVWPRRRS
ncbi:hypothetical protein [Mucisphaera calidilacus]|uniref:Uncharacterized protein n=1 Tax=Mucisphaera calidilacus TaxID=2527982 RepID=A0A518BYW0_9BACT|nr:hypothetical protein [Mucisphaera calidilacus]QDU72162.1 hypothetical protein Pan265_20250 [Mucisphaera calidilacus]